MSGAASLAMYDFPWLASENDALWQDLRANLAMPDAPMALERCRALAIVLQDGPLFAQTCGYPLLTSLRGVVRLVATPVYDLPGCDEGYHRSFVVVRDDDPADSLAALRGRRVAINGWDSNSGMNLLRAAVAPLAEGGRFFGPVILTGAHLNSAAAVRENRADVAAIDCVTWGLTARDQPALLAGLRILTVTDRSPALPFVTAAATPDTCVAALRSALAAALPRSGLALGSVRLFDLEQYDVVLDYERAAVAAGYPQLA